jgi:hypothetical protein
MKLVVKIFLTKRMNTPYITYSAVEFWLQSRTQQAIGVRDSYFDFSRKIKI